MDKLDKKIRQLKAERNRDLICAAIKLNSEMHSTLVFESGLEWIRNNMSLNDEEIVSVIAKCRLFWAWWRNQWDLRDERFVYETSLTKQELPLTGMCLIMAVDLYNEMHAKQNVKLIPNKFVIMEISTALRAFNVEQIEKLKQLIYAKK
jgi:hypothetical protein